MWCVQDEGSEEGSDEEAPKPKSGFSLTKNAFGSFKEKFHSGGGDGGGDEEEEEEESSEDDEEAGGAAKQPKDNVRNWVMSSGNSFAMDNKGKAEEEEEEEYLAKPKAMADGKPADTGAVVKKVGEG